MKWKKQDELSKTFIKAADWSRVARKKEKAKGRIVRKIVEEMLESEMSYRKRWRRCYDYLKGLSHSRAGLRRQLWRAWVAGKASIPGFWVVLAVYQNAGKMSPWNTPRKGQVVLKLSDGKTVALDRKACEPCGCRLQESAIQAGNTTRLYGWISDADSGELLIMYFPFRMERVQRYCRTVRVYTLNVQRVIISSFYQGGAGGIFERRSLFWCKGCCSSSFIGK